MAKSIITLMVILIVVSLIAIMIKTQDSTFGQSSQQLAQDAQAHPEMPAVAKNDPVPSSQLLAEAKEVHERMVFFQKKGTELCFAYSHLYLLTAHHNLPLLTYVPCESVPKEKRITFSR